MSEPEIPTISVNDVGDGAYLLDVREPDEWMAGHAPHAHHLPMREVPARLAEIPETARVAVICRTGRRSAAVVADLIRQGRKDVHNVDGGMMAWAAGGRPVVNANGQPGRII